MKKLTKSILQSHITQRFIAFIVYKYLQLVIRTTSWSYVGWEKRPKDSNLLYISWHNRILMTNKMWPYDNTVNFIVSPSKDGGILRYLLSNMGYKSYVGSSGSGTGIGPFRKALKILKQGGNFAIAPDGSRGPRYHMKPGVAFLMRATKTNALLASYNIKNRIVFKSWDKIVFPLPFSKGVIYYDVVEYDEAESQFGLERVLEKRLIKLTQNSDRYFNHLPIKKKKED